MQRGTQGRLGSYKLYDKPMVTFGMTHKGGCGLESSKEVFHPNKKTIRAKKKKKKKHTSLCTHTQNAKAER